MPDMNGEAVLIELKKITPSMPVLLFTIYHDDPSTLSPAIKEKADGLIAKPIESGQLQATINKALGIKT